jgi:lipoprotein-anchoring transpeptidase ErfK/SrfK
MKALFTFWMVAITACVMMAESTSPTLAPVEEEAPFQIVIEDDPSTLVEDATPAAQTPAQIEASDLNRDDTDGLDVVESANASTPPSPSTVTQQPSTPASTETPVVVVAEESEAPDPEPNCGHALRPPKGFDQEVLMLQIFLDRYNFSCGVIDGFWGKGSREAMRAWQAADGRRRTQWIDPTLYCELATMFEAIIPYTITEEDVALVTGPSPATWAERSKLPLMGYESLAACIAEKFHTSERTLHYLNPGIADWTNDVKLGSVIRVPNVRQAALTPVARIVIVLEECLLLGYDAEGVMRLRFPCSIARKRAHLPEAGNVTVKNMAPAPNYTYDPANYGQDPSIGKMILPPGPRNPVGSRWIGLSLPGYGIHGTPKPNTVGRPESRGCFRLANWNAEKLFELVKPGVRVEIVQSFKDIANQRPAPTLAPQNTDESAN